jgi:uncharacterized membrane protein
VSLINTLARPAVLGALLAASVAGNLFLGGILAGRIGGHAMHPPLLERGLESKFGLLPEDQRRELRKQMREARPAMREHHRRMRELHEAIATELARDAPDRATLEQQFADVRQQSLAMQESLQAGFLDTALKLAPAERRRMLDAMEGGRHRGHGPSRDGFGRAPGMPPP